MNIKPLRIGDISLSTPIIQGGMGVGVSLAGLASAVTRSGGLGVISSAQIGFREPTFAEHPRESNLIALKKEIQLAKDKCNNGPIGVNIMVATKGYADYIKTAIEAGIDVIISGAGLPTMLPKLVKDSKVKIAPIVSSLKGAKVLLKLWDRHDNVAPDMVVIEGPKAGGHLGFNADILDDDIKNFDNTIPDIIEEVKKYSVKYSKEIPVIVAGGVFDGDDVAKYLNIGANGVQMGTRFVATEECDASLEYKMSYVNSKKEDITIVKSPVGMPGRAIINPFVSKTREHKIPISRCYGCLVPCNPAESPYCISKALINAVDGHLDEGLLFCGANAYKVDKITTVDAIFTEIKNRLLEL